MVKEDDKVTHVKRHREVDGVANRQFRHIIACPEVNHVFRKNHCVESQHSVLYALLLACVVCDLKHCLVFQMHGRPCVGGWCKPCALGGDPFAIRRPASRRLFSSARYRRIRHNPHERPVPARANSFMPIVGILLKRLLLVDVFVDCGGDA